jgi:hypothetical protein
MQNAYEDAPGKPKANAETLFPMFAGMDPAF